MPSYKMETVRDKFRIKNKQWTQIRNTFPSEMERKHPGWTAQAWSNKNIYKDACIDVVGTLMKRASKKAEKLEGGTGSQQRLYRDLAYIAARTANKYAKERKQAAAKAPTAGEPGAKAGGPANNRNKEKRSQNRSSASVIAFDSPGSSESESQQPLELTGGARIFVWKYNKDSKTMNQMSTSTKIFGFVDGASMQDAELMRTKWSGFNGEKFTNWVDEMAEYKDDQRRKVYTFCLADFETGKGKLKKFSANDTVAFTFFQDLINRNSGNIEVAYLMPPWSDPTEMDAAASK